MSHSVEADIDIVKSLILEDYPKYNTYNETRKKNIISFYVKPCDQLKMYEYIEKESRNK